jgi:hypothetical protein
VEAPLRLLSRPKMKVGRGEAAEELRRVVGEGRAPGRWILRDRTSCAKRRVDV